MVLLFTLSTLFDNTNAKLTKMKVIKVVLNNFVLLVFVYLFKMRSFLESYTTDYILPSKDLMVKKLINVNLVNLQYMNIEVWFLLLTNTV